jgi:hypothetical protein
MLHRPVETATHSSPRGSLDGDAFFSSTFGQ